MQRFTRTKLDSFEASILIVLPAEMIWSIWPIRSTYTAIACFSQCPIKYSDVAKEGKCFPSAYVRTKTKIR